MINRPPPVPTEPIGPGAIAMAAYNPDPALFQRQLLSIRNQTFEDFTCIISSDGRPGETADLVREFTDGDDRFSVIGHEDRLGFYRNFERALAGVSGDVSWIALSDQDDYWYPEKLDILLPYLRTNLLVSAQANVVNANRDMEVMSTTHRQNVSFGSLVTQNQFTGGQMVFRSSLLAQVLPFPGLDTRTQVHDHWIAVVAAALGPTLIIDTIVQDYVQHGGNALGEVERTSVLSSIGSALDLAEKYAGRRTLGALVDTYSTMSYGWRRVMMERLGDVVGDTAGTRHDVRAAMHGFGRSARLGTAGILVRGVVRREVAPSCALEFVVGLPGEALRGFRTGQLRRPS